MKKLSRFLFALFGMFAGSGLQAANEVVSDPGDAGPNTLRQAIANIIATGDPTNTITFAAGMNTQTISLTTGHLLVNGPGQSIAINASSLANGVTLSAGYSSRIFVVSNNASLSLTGLTLIEGAAPNGANPEDPGEHGGAIYFQGLGDLILSECLITSNTAGTGNSGTNSGDGGNGGGIWCLAGHVLIEDTRFTFNSAGDAGNGSNVPGDGGNGGALCVMQATSITLERCEFNTNYAGDGGSATSTNGGGGGGFAGAAYLINENAPLTIRDCVFENNFGGNGGETTSGTSGHGGNAGALLIEDPSITSARQKATIEDTVFSGNRTGSAGNPTTGPGGIAGEGGGLSIQGAILDILRCRFGNNFTGMTTAAAGGASAGGINIGPSGQSNAVVKIENTTIHDNTAGFGGGGILVNSKIGETSDVDIFHSTIVDNDAGNLGGGVYAVSGIVDIESSILAQNTAPSFADLAINIATVNTVGNNFVAGDPQLSFLTVIAPGRLGFIPQVGSPVLDDAVAVTPQPKTDARGFPRRFGSAADLGAVELTFQPDNRIGRKANPHAHTLNDFYTPSGAGQRLNVKLRGRRFSKFWNSVENDGDVDSFRLRQSKVKRQYKTKSFRLTGGRVNVTAALKRGGFILTNVGYGATTVFQHRVKRKGSGRVPKLNLKLTAQSTTNGISPDAVRAKVKPGK